MNYKQTLVIDNISIVTIKITQNITFVSFFVLISRRIALRTVLFTRVNHFILALYLLIDQIYLVVLLY